MTDYNLYTGMECDRKDLKVDDRLRTTQKHNYVAGDMTGA